MTTDDFCCYLQNRLTQTSQAGDQWYSDTSPLQYSLALTIRREVVHSDERTKGHAHYAVALIIAVKRFIVQAPQDIRRRKKGSPNFPNFKI